MVFKPSHVLVRHICNHQPKVPFKENNFFIYGGVFSVWIVLYFSFKLKAPHFDFLTTNICTIARFDTCQHSDNLGNDLGLPKHNKIWSLLLQGFPMSYFSVWLLDPFLIQRSPIFFHSVFPNQVSLNFMLIGYGGKMMILFSCLQYVFRINAGIAESGPRLWKAIHHRHFSENYTTINALLYVEPQWC